MAFLQTLTQVTDQTCNQRAEEEFGEAKDGETTRHQMSNGVKLGFLLLSLDGRGMDTTGEAPPLQCADIQRQQWHRRCRLDRRDHGTARLHVWLRVSVSLVGQRVALSVPERPL